VSFVLDASVALGWCFPDEGGSAVSQARAQIALGGAVVPALWLLEVANGLVVAERRGRIAPGASGIFLEDLLALPIEVEAAPADPGASTARLLELARSHGLSVYDAAYLDLALREDLPLATLDAALAAACASAGVGLVGPGARGS
jgi:predicted nucleic acid-binding protein